MLERAELFTQYDFVFTSRVLRRQRHGNGPWDDLLAIIHAVYTITSRLTLSHFFPFERSDLLFGWTPSFCACFKFSISSYFRDSLCSVQLTTMNWTEGGLARHSRASKGRVVLLRQKEHFAKARSGLLNSNVKISPPSISFLAHPAASSSSLHRSSKSNNVPGCASSPKKRTRDQDPPHSSQYFQDDTGSNLPTPADFQRHLADEDALRQRRRKLLLKGDWTGTNLQKPIQMEFSKARESHDGPWSLLGSRHARSSKDRQRRMLGIEQGLVQYRGNHHAAKPTRPVSPRHLRVRVGSRERALGGSSNASPRSRTCRDVESSPQGLCKMTCHCTEDHQADLCSTVGSIPQLEVEAPRKTKAPYEP